MGLGKSACVRECVYMCVVGSFLQPNTHPHRRVPKVPIGGMAHDPTAVGKYACVALLNGLKDQVAHHADDGGDGRGVRAAGEGQEEAGTACVCMCVMCECVCVLVLVCVCACACVCACDV